jgi:flagellar hook-associated protein 1 FlgK
MDENAASKRGVLYYMDALDLMATTFAEAMNQVNQGFVVNEDGDYVNKDGDVIATAADGLTYTLKDTDTLSAKQQAFLEENGDLQQDGTYKAVNGVYVDAAGNNLEMTYSNGDVLTDDQMAEITATGAQFLGCVLFSNRGDNDDPTGITAANISISSIWQTGPQIVNSFVQPTALGSIASTDSSNIDHMLYLFEKDFDYFPNKVVDGSQDSTMFTGSFQEMWVNLGAVLGNDMKITSTQLDTFYASSVSLDTSRDSVSAVDLNDEATNLIMYSKSYQAACRLMTTIDSMLDKLINGTGVT